MAQLPRRYPGLPEASFLYSAADTPWPVANRPHYEGLAPAIAPIPPAEHADWQTHVAAYYERNIVGFGFASAAASFRTAFEHESDYPDLGDARFTLLVTEGLYSKYLGPLDPRDRLLFAEQITDEAHYLYLKSDQTAMRVIRSLWPGEAVAPSITLVRRRRDDDDFRYEVVAILLQQWDADGRTCRNSEILRPGDGEAWAIARYFVLQGAIHRINLIDHPMVHFPADTINALTKSVLPKDNLILRLLQPHCWLSLPVDNAVLEGQRSIINPTTWYPWCPFAARGSEVHKLLPFYWFGSQFYASDGPDRAKSDPWFDTGDSSYLPFRFRRTPAEIPSHYGVFLKGYHAVIRRFTGGVVAQMTDDDWQQAAFWADQIAPLVPGFPTGADLVAADGRRDADLLADVTAQFIWNAAVVHASDHHLLHEMFEGRGGAGPLHQDPVPVPFILRVKPPMTRDYRREAVPLDGTHASLVDRLDRFVDHLLDRKPLSWPTDNVAAHLADQLFYMPHNTLCLAEVGVSGLAGDGNRSYRGFDTPALAALVGDFHRALHDLDAELARHPLQQCVPLADMASSVQY